MKKVVGYVMFCFLGREKREDVSDGLDNEGSKDDLDDEASTEEPQPFIAQLTRLPITREEVRNKQAADRRKLRVIREAATEMYPNSPIKQ